MPTQSRRPDSRCSDRRLEQQTIGSTLAVLLGGSRGHPPQSPSSCSTTKNEPASVARVVRGLSPLVKTVFDKRTKPARFWWSCNMKGIAVDAHGCLQEALRAWIKLPAALVVCRSDESLAAWNELTAGSTSTLTQYRKTSDYMYLVNWGSWRVSQPRKVEHPLEGEAARNTPLSSASSFTCRHDSHTRWCK